MARKTEIWFEIGTADENGETHTVYRGTLLSDCIREYKEQKYYLGDYFIDVWEFEDDRTPVPVANIDLTSF